MNPRCLTERRTEEARQLRKDYREKYGKDFSPRRGKEVVPRQDEIANCVTSTVTVEQHIIISDDFQPTYEPKDFIIEESNGMKVNSFFCGAGGFDQGFIQAGFEIAGAWDFDKYAVQSYNHNIGGSEQTDVSLMKGEQLPNAHGWLFGFPCQDISIAGRQAGMIKGETRSGLFYEIMRLLGEVSDKPEWILAENVKAVNKFIPTIEEEYDKAGYTLVSPQLYNTKFEFLPQNRERYFLLGIRKDLAKSFIFPQQQKDFIPKLSSILEENVDEKYYIDDLKAAKIIEQAIEGLRVKQATKKGYDIAVEGDSINISHPNSKTRRGRVGKQVAQTLLTGTEQVVVLAEQPKIEMVGMLDMKGNETVRRVYDPEGLAPTLTTSEGGHRQPKILEAIQSVFTDKDNCAYCCDANYSKGISPGDVGNYRRTHVIEQQYRVRKLTPREYARLQGFSDSYQQVVSNSQFYKQMGNAVSVPVAYKIAKAIKEQL
jgi:DNA (cytosine-5)-methyltransferase 1